MLHLGLALAPLLYLRYSWRVKVKISEPLNGRTVSIGRGLAVIAPSEVHLTEIEPDPGGAFEAVEGVHFVVDFVDGMLGATKVTVEAREGHKITSTDLRDMRVQNWVSNAAARMLKRRRVQADGTVVLTAGGPYHLTDEEVLKVKAAGPTDESLEVAAEFYEFAKALGRPPAKEVEQQLDLPRTTASNWIRKARERGLLDGEH